MAPLLAVCVHARVGVHGCTRSSVCGCLGAASRCHVAAAPPPPPPWTGERRRRAGRRRLALALRSAGSAHGQMCVCVCVCGREPGGGRGRCDTARHRQRGHLTPPPPLPLLLSPMYVKERPHVPTFPHTRTHLADVLPVLSRPARTLRSHEPERRGDAGAAMSPRFTLPCTRSKSTFPRRTRRGAPVRGEDDSRRDGQSERSARCCGCSALRCSPTARRRAPPLVAPSRFQLLMLP